MSKFPNIRASRRSVLILSLFAGLLLSTYGLASPFSDAIKVSVASFAVNFFGADSAGGSRVNAPIADQLVTSSRFGKGNVVVYRVGDGTAGLNSNATAVFIDEFTPSGSIVQSIAMPTAVNGSQKRLTASGSAISEGFLTRSMDGRYLLVPGYDAALGTGSVTSSASSSVNRVIGRISASAAVDTSTSLTDAISGGNVRSAASVDGSSLFISGTSSSGGIRATSVGSTTSTGLASAPTNLRAVGIYNNQLYISSAITNFFGLSTVGSGLPTTAGQTISLLPGFPTTVGPSPYGFAFLNANTLYVADDRSISSSGGLQKWTFDGSTWTLSRTLNAGLTSGLRGLALTTDSNGQAVIFATSADSLTKLVRITDTGSTGDTFTTIATASTNTAFRGVALAPVDPSLSISDVSANEGNAGTTTFSFTVNLDMPAPAGGVTFDIATADDSAVAGSDYSSRTLTDQTIPQGSTSYRFDVNVTGDTTVEPDETFFVNLTNPNGATVGDGQAQGTIINDDVTADSTQSSDYFRSKATGNWNAIGTWQSSHDGSTWIDATATPTSAANTITIQAGHTVDAAAAVNIDQTVVDGTLIAENNTVTVDDGTGDDITVGSTGTLVVNGGLANNGQINILNILQITTGFPNFTGTGSISYDAAATLVYSGSSTLTAANTASTAMFWPILNGPQNFTVLSGGGADIQVPRTLNGTLATFAGLYSAQNYTINGTLQLGYGELVSGSPTYGPNSLLKYDLAGHAANRGAEWLQAVTSGPGYPNDVQVSGNTPLNIAFGATNLVQMGGKLTIDDGSSATMSGMFSPLNVGGGMQLDGTFSLSASGGDLHLMGGDWNRGTNGVLNRAGRSVYFEATGDQTIYGDNTFDGLVITASTARTVKFEAGKTQTANSGCQITGSAGNVVSLRSTVDGTQWKIVAANGANVNYADVKDSDATGSYPNGITPNNSVNSGNNTKWNFPIPVTLTDFGVSPASGSEAAQSAITLTATLSPAPTTNKTVTISIDGTGITGDDYRNSLGNITVLAGHTTGSIDISINDDAFVEGPETANVHASMDGVTKDASFTIVDNDSNPPTATNLSAAESYTEDTTLNLIDIVVADADSSTTTATLTLSNASAGSLTTATAGTTTSAFNSGTGVWSASGPISEVNALLASVSFVPASNFNSNFSISTSVTDGQSTPATGIKAVTGTAVNDAPTATNLSASETYIEDTNLNLTDIVVSDPDSSTVTVTLALSDASAGALSVGTSGTTTSVFNSGTGVWTATGPIAEVNTLLANVSYTPTANFNGNFTIAASVSDGIAAAVTGSKAMLGTAVNDAPVLDAAKSPAMLTEGVDGALPVGPVGTLVSQLVDPTTPAGQLDNVSDIDSGAMLGVAIIATDTAHGSWFYSTNGGATWSAMGAVSDSGARVLAADAGTRIYFRPDAGFNGSIPAAVTFRAWDQTMGLNGGVIAAAPNGGPTAFSSSTDTASIVINAGAFEFSSAAYSGVEGDVATLTVTRSTSSGTSSVNYTAADSSATGGTCSSGVDYQPASGTLNFGQGVSTQTITIPLCSDLVSESPAETFTVTLDSPSGSTLGSQTSTTVSIIDAASEFVSTTPITLADGLPGNPNPSTLDVTGYTSSILGLRLTLYNVTKPTSGDLSVMLVDPSGNRNFVVMTGVGGSNTLNNATITLEDAATSYMPQNSALVSGTNYWPTSCGPDPAFAPPAPVGPHNTAGCDPTDRWTFASAFNGLNPNGTWKLYVMDESGSPLQGISAVTGSIGGWGMQFLLPTAAPVSISGRVRTVQGEGIRGATVTLTGGDLAEPMVVRTGTFGAYSFKNLRPGTTYVVSVSSSRYTFASPVRSVSLIADLAGMDFVSRKQE